MVAVRPALVRNTQTLKFKRFPLHVDRCLPHHQTLLMAVTSNAQLYDGTCDTTAVVVAIFIALSLYNASELVLLIFSTFKRWRGLYFWSLAVATAAILPYSVGMLLWYYKIGPSYAGSVPNNIGWIAMVTGQSLVLYSRLHLVLRNEKLLRGIFWMIIIDAIALYTSTTVVQFGSYSEKNIVGFKKASYVLEKVQMTGFTTQELIISGLYMREISRLTRSVFDYDRRRTLRILTTVQVIIVLLDIGLLILEYCDLIIYQETFKSVAYSVKLKMEFAVLGKLISGISHSQTAAGQERMTRHRSATTTPPSSAANHVEPTCHRSRWISIPENGRTEVLNFELRPKHEEESQ